MGQTYKIKISDPQHDYNLKKNDGYIMPEKKLIVLDRNNVDVHMRHVLRHEVVHAFLYESGLDNQAWAENEEIVDWISIQLDKIYHTVKKYEKDSRAEYKGKH